MDEAKKAAAEHAVSAFIKSGMTIGLGTGSTASFVTHKIGSLLHSGELRDVKCVCTSASTENLATSLGIPTLALSDVQSKLDVAIDGADEIDPEKNIIKGRGGALYREKFIEQRAIKFIVVADESKLVPHLGVGRLPVEICSFNPSVTLARIRDALEGEGLSLKSATIRKDGNSDKPFITDDQRLIVDLLFKDPMRAFTDTLQLHLCLKSLTGVIETGLFINMSPIVVIASQDGGVRVL